MGAFNFIVVFINIHSLLSFVIATKETKSLGRKDIQPLPAVQLCGTAVLLWFVLFIFIVRLQCRQLLLIVAAGHIHFDGAFK